MTSRAEIEALARALDVVHAVTVSDFKLSQIKVTTDSSFLVNAVAVWMDGWLANGGASSRSGRVAHFERLRQLSERLDEMEYGDDGGIEVQFWHVPREMNREADALAKAALDSA
ncbi:hypothetical protein SLS56_003139 [Neofusicoccum ribis]|uniref:RNase H type-1 domain-containing protein n=1 Tax=Neofusicoccum ribis TaxID=45134 RepID=A0ABR3T0F7_9PEZI